MNSDHTLFQHAELDGSTFHFTGNRSAGVLCIHGLTATTTEVRPLAQYLNKEGFTAYGPLLPGHGTTPEDLNRTTWLNWVEEARKELDILSKECSDVFVAGESMGALVSLWLARLNPKIKGVLLYAPALELPNSWAAGLVSRFIPYIKKKSTDDTMPWKGYFVNPTRAVYQLHLFQNEIRKVLSEIRQPTLIFQGAMDQTIDPHSAVEILMKIGSSKKGLIWLNSSSHCLLLDREQDYVFALSTRFLESIIDSRSSSVQIGL